MQLHCEPVPDMACWVRQATRAADTAQLRHVSCKLSSLYPRGRLAVPDFYKTGARTLKALSLFENSAAATIVLGGFR